MGQQGQLLGAIGVSEYVLGVWGYTRWRCKNLGLQGLQRLEIQGIEKFRIYMG